MDIGAVLLLDKFIRAYSIVAVHPVCIRKAGVRFSLGPQGA